MTSREKINEITGKIVDAAMKVHTVLGPGLLESAYEAYLAYELDPRGLKVVPQAQWEEGRPFDQLQHGTPEGRDQQTGERILTLRRSFLSAPLRPLRLIPLLFG